MSAREAGGAVVNDSTSREIAELYWNTSVSANKIAETYSIRVSQVPKVAGPIVLSDVLCRHCKNGITVKSRAREKQMRDRPDCRICPQCFHDWARNQTARFKEREQKRADRLRELRTMSYRAYLQTPEWQETRRLALRRVYSRCQTCCGGGQLNVHHRTYVRRGAEYARDLVVLCSPCHQLFHERSQLAEGGTGDR